MASTDRIVIGPTDTVRFVPPASPPPVHHQSTSAPPPDFLGEHFPEHAFPAPPPLEQDHRRRCGRGYAAMAQARVAIAGLARNLADVLPTTIRRVEHLGRLFADYRIFVYENDSTDGTKDILRAWAAKNRRVLVTSEDCHDPVNPTTRCLRRIDRMARYRQRCQEAVLQRCADFDHAIVVDFDVAGGWSADGIASSFGHDDWDFIGSNGLIYRREGLAFNALRQYDMWALRFDEHFTALPTKHADRYRYRRGEPLVPVTSCFGGLGIYTMPAFASGRYGSTDIEHVVFHRELRQRGFPRLFLNPSQILVYGRRHRFADAWLRRAAGALARVTGAQPQPWQFDVRPAARRAA